MMMVQWTMGVSLLEHGEHDSNRRQRTSITDMMMVQWTMGVSLLEHGEHDSNRRQRTSITDMIDGAVDNGCEPTGAWGT